MPPMDSWCKHILMSIAQDVCRAEAGRPRLRAVPMLGGRSFEERGLERADDLTRVAQLLGDTSATNPRSPDSQSMMLSLPPN